MADYKFFMVFVEGERYPQYRHQSSPGAEKEAARLARLTNKKVYILESMACVKVAEAPIEVNLLLDELPKDLSHGDLPF